MAITLNSCDLQPAEDDLLLFIWFQVGEFFHLAQSIAAAEQREQEVQQNREGSIDSPLLLEQVCFCCLSVGWTFIVLF